MAHFESSLGKSKQETSHRSFVVEDESQTSNTYQEERVLSPAEREAYLSEKREIIAVNNKLDARSLATAKERIEFLASLGRTERDVPISGVVFTLRSLKNSELKAIVKDISGASKLDAMTFILARSLYKIDGQHVELTIGSDKIEDKISFIGELQDGLILRLHSEFEIMEADKNERFGIHSAEDIKEVQEDVKK